MRHRGITEKDQTSFDADVWASYDEALRAVISHLEKAGVGPAGTQEEHDLAVSYAEWLVSHNTQADRETYPFCWDCGWGHNSAKISCEEVDEIVSADEEIGRGM